MICTAEPAQGASAFTQQVDFRQCGEINRHSLGRLPVVLNGFCRQRQALTISGRFPILQLIWALVFEPVAEITRRHLSLSTAVELIACLTADGHANRSALKAQFAPH